MVSLRLSRRRCALRESRVVNVVRTMLPPRSWHSGRNENAAMATPQTRRPPRRPPPRPRPPPRLMTGPRPPGRPRSRCRCGRSVLEPLVGVVEPAGGLLQQDAARILGGPMPVLGCEFRAASQTGSEARQLRLRGVPEKQAVFTLGRAYTTHRAAVDPCGGDRGEELPVEPCVARAQGAVTGIGVKLGVCGKHVGMVDPSVVVFGRFRTCAQMKRRSRHLQWRD